MAERFRDRARGIVMLATERRMGSLPRNGIRDYNGVRVCVGNVVLAGAAADYAVPQRDVPHIYVTRHCRYSHIDVDLLRGGDDFTEQAQSELEQLAFREAQECFRAGRRGGLGIGCGVDYFSLTMLRARENEVLGALVTIASDPSKMEARRPKWVRP
jgi:hypothetical protein